MTEIETRLLEATLSVVARYGIRKTSLTDIVQESGLSRQTIYNAFGSKNGVIRAMISYATETARQALSEKLVERHTLSDQIDAVFEELVIEPFKFTQESPEARDIFQETHIVAPDLLEDSMIKNASLIARVLEPHNETLISNGLSAEGLAQTLEFALHGFRRDAIDEDQLISLLRPLKTLVLISAQKNPSSGG